MMQTKPEAVPKTACSVCGSSRLEAICHLPNFPITGIFVEQPVSGPIQGVDQTLNRCADCSHVQLSQVVSPAKLYGEGYAHRSSLCELMPAASQTFIAYVDRLTEGRTFDSILEIGCNDLMLLRKMAPRGRRVYGIDPIWKGRLPDVDSNVKIIGNFIEEVDLARELEIRPQLIFSVHNLEHISEPAEQMARLMDVAADDALFVIEVPDLDIMVNNLRFDQVFHQHVHYFSLASFLKMVERLGGEYVDHCYDYRNWGGSLIVAFRKSGKRHVPAGTSLTNRHIADYYSWFRRRMAEVKDQVLHFDSPVWGYGAGQMVPSVAYHLDSDLSFLRGILDDNPQRAGLYLTHLVPRIRPPGDDIPLDRAAVMVLALDHVPAILNRLRAFQPRHIVVPINVF